MSSIRELFAKHSLRCTRQRMAVYESLAECEGHPTAEEIYRLVLPRTHRLSRATVYNVLEALCRAGLVRRMATMTGSCRYEVQLGPHLHVCLHDSDEFHDVPPELSRRLLQALPQDLLDEIGERLDVRIDGVEVQLKAWRGRAAG